MSSDTAKAGGQNSQLGKYQILKKLAVGGMAEIYLARATGIQGFEKHVVLKRILPEHARDERFVEMFLDEARLAARLQHHNIAQVYDIGQANGAFFFSMEYLHGEDLRALLKTVAQKGDKIPLKHVLTIIAGACAGLHYAHDKKGTNGKSLNIVHRDISPSNIIVTYDGGVKVVDFGIARATERSTETRTNSLKGKISYMSPEQCVGKDLDRRSDIFCLGIVLYELSTVSRLFRANPDESDYVVMDRIVNGKITPPSKRLPGYPPELENIVMRALQLDREDRYETAKDMLIDIEGYAAQERIPLSTASLSRYLEDIFGPRPEPWHDLNHNPVEPEPLHKTVSTTGAVAPYQAQQDSLEGTVLTISDPEVQQQLVSEDARTLRTPMGGAMTIPPDASQTSPTVGPGQVLVNPQTLPPGSLPPGMIPAMLNQQTGQMVPVQLPNHLIQYDSPKGKSKTTVFALAALAVLVIAVGLYFALGGKDEAVAKNTGGTNVITPGAVDAAVASSSSSVAQVEVDAAVVMAPAKVKILFRGERGAVIYDGDDKLGTVPFTHEVERNSPQFSVEARRRGYKDRTYRVRTNIDREINIDLTRKKYVPASSKAKSSSSKSKSSKSKSSKSACPPGIICD